MNKSITKTYFIDNWKDKIKAIFLIIIGRVCAVSCIIPTEEFYKN